MAALFSRVLAGVSALAICGLTLLGLSGVARATAAPAVSLLAERSNSTNLLREPGVGGATLTVGHSNYPWQGTTYSTVSFLSQVGSQTSTLQTVDISSALTAGTYATSRIPGQAAVILDPSFNPCGDNEPGTLRIEQAAYDSAGLPTSFAASFDVENCVDDGPPIHGEIRWHSSTPVAVATAPTSVSIAKKVAANSTADVPVTFTVHGNSPARFGTPTLRETPLSDGSRFWSIAAQTCSTAPVAAGRTCTVTLRFSAGYPNGVPNYALHATLSLSDGRATPVTVDASAQIADIPGEPTFLRIDSAFRHLTFYWAGPDSLPDGWSSSGTTTWNIFRQRPASAKQLVASFDSSSFFGGMSYVLPGLPAGYGGTFTVQGVQNGVTGAPSIAITTNVASRELVYTGSATGPHNQQLAPVSGTDYSYSGHSSYPDHDLAVSNNETVLAGDYLDNTSPQRASIVLSSVDGSETTFADVSGGDGSAEHFDIDPALSPDGSQVVYTHGATADDTDTVLRVASVHAPDSVRDLPNTTGLTDATFTADGSSLVAVAHGTTTSLVQVDLITGDVTALSGTDGLSEPAVAADGRVVAVRVAADGSSQLVVMSHPGSVPAVQAGVPAGFNWRPSWTRDGKIVFDHRDDLAPIGDEYDGNAVQVDPSTGAVTKLSNVNGGVETPLVLVDDAADTVSPRPVLAVAQAAPGLSSTTAVKWSASDPTAAATVTSGVASYDVRYRTATATHTFTAYSYPASWQATTATQAGVASRVGTEYCFSTRARDHEGNLSAWTADQCVVRAADDRSLSGSASRGSNSRYFAGTYTRLAKGGKLSLGGVTARQVGVVLTTCSSCGSVYLYLAGHRVGSVSGHSTSTRYQQVRWLPVSSSRTGMLQIVTSGTTPVYVDGFVSKR